MTFPSPKTFEVLAYLRGLDRGLTAQEIAELADIPVISVPSRIDCLTRREPRLYEEDVERDGQMVTVYRLLSEDEAAA